LLHRKQVLCRVRSVNGFIFRLDSIYRIRGDLINSFYLVL